MGYARPVSLEQTVIARAHVLAILTSIPSEFSIDIHKLYVFVVGHMTDGSALIGCFE